MRHFSFAALSSASVLLSLVQAGPVASPLQRRYVETDVNRCRPLDPGRCTLSVISSLVGVLHVL